MKKKFSLIVLWLAIIFTACKKDKDVPSHAAKKPLIATIRQTMSNNQAYNVLRTFIYDSASRLTEVKFSGANTADIVEKYNYAGATVQYRHYVKGLESNSVSADYMLNAEGKVQKTYSSYYNSATIHEYNNAGYISRLNFLRDNKGSGHQLFYYSNDNKLDSIVGYSPELQVKYVHTFTYEPGLKSTIGNENKGLAFLGKDYASPIKRRTWYVYDYPGKEGVRMRYMDLDYSYESDSQSRIKKYTLLQTQHSSSGASQSYISEVMEYTYK